MMKYFFLKLMLVFSLAPHASPWFNFDDYDIEFIYSGLQKHCEILDERFIIGCSKNAIQILVLKKEGKQRISAEEFLKGNKIKVGVNLENNG